MKHPHLNIIRPNINTILFNYIYSFKLYVPKLSLSFL
jgi:hypothetical protein